MAIRHASPCPAFSEIVHTNLIFLRVRAADTINARHSLRKGSHVSLNSRRLCEFARLFWSRDPPFDYPSRSAAPRAQIGLVGQDVSGPATICHAVARNVQFIADLLNPAGMRFTT